MSDTYKQIVMSFPLLDHKSTVFKNGEYELYHNLVPTLYKVYYLCRKDWYYDKEERLVQSPL